MGYLGTGAISNFAILIASYLVAAPMASFLITELLEEAKQSFARAADLLFRISFVVAAGFAFINQLRIIDTRFALVTHPDLRAMQWIAEHTPHDSKFLVDSFSAYGGSAIVGSDAGWWIPLLARRANTVPPLTYLVEREGKTDFHERVNELALSWISGSKPINLVMQEAGVDYVYLGQTHTSHRNLPADLASSPLLSWW